MKYGMSNLITVILTMPMMIIGISQLWLMGMFSRAVRHKEDDFLVL